MLFSMSLGVTDKTINEWQITGDKYKNTFFSNADIRQKIRLGKNVNPLIQSVAVTRMHGIETDANDVEVVEYESPCSVFLSNNNKNMNLSLMNFWSKDKEVMEQHDDDVILYLTVANNAMRVLDIDNCGNKIIQTYRQKGTDQGYQGCVLTFKEPGDVIKLVVQKATDGLFIPDHEEFYRIEIIFNPSSSNCKIDCDVKKITGKHQAKFVKLSKKYVDGHAVPFKIAALPGELLTSTYIVDKELVPEVEAYLKESKLPFYNIIPATQEEIDDLTGDIADVLTTQVVDARVRAITAIGINLSFEFCREYRILYLFNMNMDDETKQLKCIKSN